jgi:hypothetical protein
VVYAIGMGAWAHGSFANDTASDWLADLREGDPSLLSHALTAVTEADADAYLDSDECTPALAAAELVAAAHGKGEDRLNDDAREWLEAHRSEAAIDLGLARRAVERIFVRSELRELWDENGPRLDDEQQHGAPREDVR